MRFKERSSDLLFDCKLMKNGVIVRQSHPNDQNIDFLSFEDFVERFEETTCQN